MPETISRVQELNLELIREASFNNFDGPRVVDSLLANKDLWRAVLIDREGFVVLDVPPGAGQLTSYAIDLIKLRDLESGYWNVDTLFILPAEGKAVELELLTQDWDADEVDWYSEDVASRMLGAYSAKNKGNPRMILRVWWD